MSEIIKRTQQIVIEECGDLRLIMHPERNFILSKEDMPKRNGDLWEYKKWEKMLHFYSDKYLATYHEGNWGDYGEDYELDMVEKWLERDFRNLYRGFPSNDGYLYNVDGSPLLRKIKCEFWASYYTDLDKLKAELEKNEQWSNFEWEMPHWSVERDISGSRMLNAAYLPTQAQLNKWFARKNVSYGAQGLGGSFGVLHDFKYIAKFKKTPAQ